MKTLGTLLRRLRQSKRLSQTEVATALGIHQTTYSDWEKDEGSPKWSQVIELAGLFEQPAWVFLDEDSTRTIEFLLQENKSLRDANERLSEQVAQLSETIKQMNGKWGG
jgi:transcriptional regulator with XRE-family HTH domain